MSGLCLHCGSECSDDFCCAGCGVAYRLIHSLNLGKFYEYCESIYQSRPTKIMGVENRLDYITDIATDGDGSHSIYLLVEGMHCGSCVWLIESTLAKQSGIMRASLNLSTKRLYVKWCGEKEAIKEYVATIQSLGYNLIPFTPDASDAESLEIQQSLLLRVGVSGLGSVAMMMMLWGVWAGNIDGSMGYYTRFLIHILSAVIAIPATVYSGWHFFESAYRALSAGRTNMDVPISIGVIATLGLSIYQTVYGKEYVYFDAALSLLFFLLLGRFLDVRMRNKARLFIVNLLAAQPKVATVESKGQLVLIPIKRLVVGDIVYVGVGDKVPADGVIIEGATSIDNSLVTGESIPISAGCGSIVLGGTINVDAPIKVRITSIGENTLLGEMLRLIEIANQNKSRYVQVADRISQYFTPFVIICGIATFCLWFFGMGSDLKTAAEHSIALIIITCPCALGLAVPAVQMRATQKLMEIGILVRTQDAIEKLSKVRKMIFDKTGTLTEGKPALIDIEEIPILELEVGYTLSSYSKHPLSKAIVAVAKRQNLERRASCDIREYPGLGVEGIIEGKLCKMGSAVFCGAALDVAEAKYSGPEVWLRIADQKPYRFRFVDEIKPGAQKVISTLREYGLETEILSGDKQEVVEVIAGKLGIKTYYAEQSPSQKYEYVAGQILPTAVIGDGLNDAAALKSSFVSISWANSVDIVQNNSDIIIQKDAILPVLISYIMSVRAMKLIRYNFGMSLIYNVLSIPLAMCGLVNPIIASVMMSVSSIMVVLNALRLSCDDIAAEEGVYV